MNIKSNQGHTNNPTRKIEPSNITMTPIEEEIRLWQEEQRRKSRSTNRLILGAILCVWGITFTTAFIIMVGLGVM